MTVEPYWIDHDDGSSLAWAVSQRIAQALRLSLQQRTRATLVLGTGPLVAAVCERLVDAVLDWRRVTVVLADEPWRSPLDPEGHAHQVGIRLGRGEARQAEIVPLVAGAGSAGDDARAAAFDLLRVAQPFDVVVVTVGEDGRLGALVPGSEGLNQLLEAAAPRTVAAVDLPDDDVPHLTLTVSALANADMVLVLGEGTAVRRTLDHALGGADLPVTALLAQASVPIEFHVCP